VNWLGIATSWGSAPDKSLRNQITSEAFYRVQVTQNLTFTPSIQLTYKPSRITLLFVLFTEALSPD